MKNVIEQYNERFAAREKAWLDSFHAPSKRTTTTWEHKSGDFYIEHIEGQVTFDVWQWVLDGDARGTFERVSRHMEFANALDYVAHNAGEGT